MTDQDMPTSFRFLDRRTGHLSPFGVDKDGVYEVTDTTLKLATQYRDGGLIEFLPEVEPLPSLDPPTPKKKKASKPDVEPVTGEVTP